MICRPELCCSCSEQKCNWKCQGHGHRRLKHHLIDLQCCRKGCKQTRAAYKTPTAIRTYPGGVKRHGGERQRGKLTRVFFQILTRRITDDRASTATTHTHENNTRLKLLVPLSTVLYAINPLFLQGSSFLFRSRWTISEAHTQSLC